MGDLKAFMLPPVMEQTEKVIVSDRFKNEKGEVVPFEIRAISQEINEGLYNQASKPVKKNGMVVGRNLDNTRYSNLLLVACTVTPNFKDAELCAYYKTKDPAEVPGRMLSSGEWKNLTSAVMKLNGYGEGQTETLEEEAKN
jgi:hypothetical protein